MYANPCTMQIILMHFADSVQLSSQSKKTNAQQIAKLTGVENYDAHAAQIDAICGQLRRSNYDKMRERLKTITAPDTVVPSTNFGEFLDRFHSSDPKWIEEINNRLHGNYVPSPPRHEF